MVQVFKTTIVCIFFEEMKVLSSGLKLENMLLHHIYICNSCLVMATDMYLQSGSDVIFPLKIVYLSELL